MGGTADEGRDTCWIGDWVGPKAHIDTVVKRNKYIMARFTVCTQQLKNNYTITVVPKLWFTECFRTFMRRSM
jgi:hypothetical protein